MIPYESEDNPLQNEYDPYEEKKPHGPVFKVFKWIGILLMLAFFGLLFFRMCIKEDPADAKVFLWTDNTLKAYEAWKVDDDRQWQDFAYTQESSYRIYNEDTRTSTTYSYDTFSCRENTYSGDGSAPENRKQFIHYGQFHTSNPVYIPSAGELQITIRVNDEGMKELMETYSLESEPAGEPFVYAIYDGTNYHTDYSFTTAERFTYTYRRLTFSGIDYTTADELELMIYYAGDGTVDLTDPYEYLTVYLSDIPVTKYDMDDAKPFELTKNLQKPPYVVIKNGTEEE
ncbi:MAG: hypothetical protein IJX76_00545 [Clostridia bacterium]|nr:hypothetical protein [Clostridia bacterium]